MPCLPMPVDHYENFPVASWLCPPPLRPAVQAIYWFARTADDIADEGSALPAERLAQLARYRSALDGGPVGPWAAVFPPLRAAMHAHALPPALLHALLDAFEQDVRNPAYADRLQLLDYCRRSANPIGRLLLHLVRVDDTRSLAQSDAICSSLQLINFWQDLGVDLPRGRCYVPVADASSHGVDLAAWCAGEGPGPGGAALVADLVRWSRAMMLEGAPLALRLSGRFAWELRGVVQGGLRVLEKIEAMQCMSWTRRPRLTAFDTLIVGWNALTMRAR